jgi:hypothetical protein
MSSDIHLLVALTPHGYGHAAMTAPVVNALRRHLPGLRLTLQTATPRAWLESRYDGPFDLISDTPDFGLKMSSAMAVQAEESAAAYRALHRDFDGVVAAEAARMSGLGIDLVLANIPYVSLAAARLAGIPAVALSCLNWADMYDTYCGDRPEAPAIISQMLQAYEQAEFFMCPAPSVPMPHLSNIRPIGPIARLGDDCRRELRQQLGLAQDAKLGLIAFGGMSSGLSFADWPGLPGWTWVVTDDAAGRPDLIAREAVDMTFTNILRSCDVVVSKPGYGTFAEAAVNGVPLLYLPRPGWPETPHLAGWLAEHGRCQAIEVDDLFSAEALASQLQKLFSYPAKPLADPSGGEEGAQAILTLLVKLGRIQK